MKPLVRNHKCVVSVLLTLLIVFGAINIAHAQQLLVSNFDQRSDFFIPTVGKSYDADGTDAPWVGLGAWTPLNQGFTTGKHGNGYRISAINLHVRFANDSSKPLNLSVSIWSRKGDGSPDSLLYTLGQSQNQGVGVQVFGGTNKAILAPNTSYLIVVKANDANSARLSLTYDDNEDAGTAPGWSIDQHVYGTSKQDILPNPDRAWGRYHDGSIDSGALRLGGFPLKIKIWGEPRTSPTTFVSLTKVDEGQFKATGTTSVPFDIVLPITVINGTILGGATNVTIPAGSTESSVINVSRTAGTTFPVVVDIGNLPSPPAGYDLYKSPSRLPIQVLEGLLGEITPVSRRTPQVRDAIVAAAGVNSANDVTEAHLAAITTLRVNHPQGQPSRTVHFQIGDFSGLTALIDLEIERHGGVRLPTGIFDDLISLESLSLYNSKITAIPNAVRRLTSLKSLNLGYHRITSISAGTFDKLTQLETLILDAAAYANTFTSLPVGVFDKLTSLTYLDLAQNRITSLPTGVFDKLTSLESLSLDRIYSLSSLPSGIFDKLTSLEILGLQGLKPAFLPDGIFSGLSSLTFLDLSGGRLTGLPAGIFSGLSSLTSLRLGRNSVDPLPLTVSLKKVADGQFKAVAPTGAPFDIVLPLNITNGSISDSAATVTISAGSVESEVLTVTRTAGTTAAVTVNIGTLPSVPSNHRGYALVKSADLPLSYALPEIHSLMGNRTPQVRDAIVAAVPGVNNAADITEGHLANIKTLNLSRKNITALKSGDFDGLSSLLSINLQSNKLTSLPDDIFTGLSSMRNLTLTYNDLTTLTAGVFSNLSSLRYLLLYGNDLSSLPSGIFDDLSSLTELNLYDNALTSLPAGIFDNLLKLKRLSLGLNELTSLPPGIFDNLTSLTYLGLGSSVYVNKRHNQIASLPDGVFSNLSSLTDLVLYNNSLSSLPDGVFSNLSSLTRLWLQGNTIDPLPLTVSLEKVTDGQFKVVVPTGAPFEMELPLTVTNGSISGGATSITISIGSVESDTFTVSRTPGTIAAVAVDIGTLPGLPADVDQRGRHLHQGYALRKSDDLPLTVIKGINTAPVFTDGIAATRTIAENTAAAVNIGTPIASIDADNDTLTYTLSGTDAAAFSIVSTTGQLQTKAALDYETKTSYSVTISVSDGNGGRDSLTVTINVTDVNENTAPVFTDGTTATRTIAENTAANINIGSPIAATDTDTGDTLTYTLSGIDAASFSIISTTGQLQTKAALDYETKTSYSVTISVSDGNGGSDSITVAITITDVNETPENTAPVFSEGNSITITMALPPKGNTEADYDVGNPLSATDADGDTVIFYSLSGADAGLFNTYVFSKRVGGQNQSYVQLTTRGWSLHDANKSSFTVIVTASDRDGGSNSITVTINVTNETENNAPVFTDGSSTTRTIAENTASNTNISTAITATDADNDRLTYTLTGTDAASFAIDPTTGQLRTKAALDYETKSAYTVTITVSDGSLTDTISVTVNITDVHEGPADTPGGDTPPPTTDTRIAFEANTPPGYTRVTLNDTGTVWGIPTKYTTDSNVGTVAYMTLAKLMDCNFAEAEAARRSIVYIKRQSLGELNNFASEAVCGTTSRTWASPWDGLRITHLRFFDETSLPNVKEAVYNAATDQIELPGAWQPPPNNTTNTAPVFADGTSTTRTIAENTAANTNIGTAITATDADNDRLTYTLTGTDAASFAIDPTTGQLRTKAALNYETKSAYTVTITVSDGSLTDMITVTITITDIAELPTTTAICKVGDVLAPGESCTYPNTDAVFSVLDNGSSQWNIPNFPWLNKVSAGGSISFTADINNENYHFVAKEVSNNSWEIEEIGDDTNQQPGTPEQPENTGETPTLNISTAAPLTEATLHGGVVTLNLSGGIFESSSFRIRNAVSVSGIGGVSFESFGGERISDTQATVELEYDGNMTANGTLTISLEADGIKDYEGATLTAQIQVPAVTESVAASTAAPLTQATLDESVVTLTLNGRKFERWNSTIRSAVAVSGIAGVTVRSLDIDRQSDTEVTIELTYDGDITSNGTLTFTVGAGAIAGYDGPALTDQVSVSASAAPADTGDQNPDPPVDDTSNTAPVFIDGGTATRTIAENTAAGQHIGTAITATDTDNDTLTYMLAGTDASSFGIDSTTGQLNTKAALDYETKSAYTVTISVSDGSLTDTIIVTINVTDINEKVADDPNPPPDTPEQPVDTGGTPTITTSTEAPLTEATLHGSVVTLTLNGKKFSRNIYDLRDAVSVSGITGITIGEYGVQRVSDTKVTIKLTFNGNLDADTTLTVNIGPGAIPGYDGPALTAQLPVISGHESITASTEAPLTETTLHDSVVTLTLSGRKFSRNIYDLRDAVSVSGITGVTVGEYGVQRVSDTEVTVKLTFDGDFDADTTLTLNISAGAIASGYGGPAFTAQLPVTSLHESITVSTAVPLTEATLNGSTVTLTLSGRIYASSDLIRSAVSVSGIPGATTKPPEEDCQLLWFFLCNTTYYVRRVSDTEVTVTLEFEGDIDTDGTLTFTVGADAIFGYNGPDLTAQITVTAIQEENGLLANFPNPFNPETWIPYQLAKPTEVTITIYNINGHVVRTLELGHQPAGTYQTRSRAAYWDGRNAFGELVASGVYFYTITAGDFTATRKMLIRK